MKLNKLYDLMSWCVIRFSNETPAIQIDDKNELIYMTNWELETELDKTTINVSSKNIDARTTILNLWIIVKDYIYTESYINENCTQSDVVLNILDNNTICVIKDICFSCDFCTVTIKCSTI